MNAPAMNTPEFDQWAARAAEIDGDIEPPLVDPNAPAPQTQIEAPPDYYRESEGAVEFFAALVIGYCPKCADIWDSGTKSRVSAALAPVMEKYGVTLGNLPPELTLLIVAGPPLYQSARLVAEHTQQKRDEAEKKRQEEAAKKSNAPYPMPKPAGAGETPEVLTHPQMGLYGK